MDETVEREFAALRNEIKLRDEALRTMLTMFEERHTSRVQSYLEQREQANEALNERLNLLNESRATIADQTATMATRREVDTLRSVMIDKADEIRTLIDSKISSERELRRTDNEAIDQRLNRIVDARQLIEARMGTLVTSEAFEAKREALSSAIYQLQRPNWAGLAVVVAVALASMSALWLAIGLDISTTVAPVSERLASTHTQAVATAEQLDALKRDLRPREYWETNSARMAVIENALRILQERGK